MLTKFSPYYTFYWYRYWQRSLVLAERYKMERKEKRRGRQSLIPPPVYNVVNGVRFVMPYVHEYNTSVKGRWLGRGLLEVLTSEFGGHSPAYWLSAMDTGRILINEKPTTKDYIFCNNGILFCNVINRRKIFASTL
jgi:hypothetical protein